MFSPMFQTAFQDATPSLLLDPSAFETGHPLWHGQTSAQSSTFGSLRSYIKNPTINSILNSKDLQAYGADGCLWHDLKYAKR